MSSSEETYGGGVRSWERDGFRFDTGPGVLHLPAVYRDLFVKTGREALEERVDLVRLDPAVRHVFPDGTAVSLPSGSRAPTCMYLLATHNITAGVSELEIADASAGTVKLQSGGGTFLSLDGISFDTSA